MKPITDRKAAVRSIEVISAVAFTGLIGLTPAASLADRGRGSIRAEGRQTSSRGTRPR